MKPLMDARHYSVREILSDGLEVQIRAMRPDDVERIAEAFAKLDEESIYLRFFGFKKGLTEQDRKLIRELDFDTRVVLVVTLMENGREIIIGSGSYSRLGSDAAEVAFLIEEDFHRRGIARRLLWHLGRVARERGITRFEAEVLPHNKPMLRVFASSGWPMTTHRADGVIHVTLGII